VRELAVVGQVEVAEALEGRGAVAPACGIPGRLVVGEGALGPVAEVELAVGVVPAGLALEELGPGEVVLEAQAELAEEREPVAGQDQAAVAERVAELGLVAEAALEVSVVQVELAGQGPAARAVEEGRPLVAQVVGAEAALGAVDLEVAAEGREPGELEVRVGKAPRRENG
jgi:hypothetical protein